MEFKTKFDIGQEVYTITLTEKQHYIQCHACKGDGHIKINEETFVCPKCSFTIKGKVWDSSYKTWVTDVSGVIGLVQAEFSTARDNEPALKHQYMIDSTGIGSGTVWKENRLFLTEEEAQKECDRLNEAKDFDPYK